MISQLLIKSSDMLTLSEDMNCLEAVDLMEDFGVRNAPILDSTGRIYRGNIYRYHIYKHKFHNPESDLTKTPVTHFLKNATKFVHIDDTFLQLIFSIQDLPYIAVLSDENSFMGVIRHSDMMNYMAEAWQLQDIKYILEINSYGRKGDLHKLTRFINRFTDITAAITQKATSFDTDTKLMLALPKDIDEVNFTALLKALTRRGYEYEYYQLF